MHEMGTDLAAHVTAGAAVVYIMEWLKNAPGFTWLNHTTPKQVKTAVSAVVSLIIALGVTWTGNSQTGWVITIPPMAAMTGVAWEFAQQFFSQQMIYDLVLNEKSRPPLTVTVPVPPQGEPHDPHVP